MTSHSMPQHATACHSRWAGDPINCYPHGGSFTSLILLHPELPSGNLLHSYGKWMNMVIYRFTMVIFNSYVKLPEGKSKIP